METDSICTQCPDNAPMSAEQAQTPDQWSPSWASLPRAPSYQESHPLIPHPPCQRKIPVADLMGQRQ